MSKFVVVVFPSETQAYQGSRALKDLHAEGSLTLYGMAVIAKDAKGDFSIKEANDPGPLGTAVGAMAGGIIGVLGGPLGVLSGVAGGSVIGSMLDLFNLGVGEDFITKVSSELEPGRCAIVAEIAEDWRTPLDTRMESLGGTVLRTWRGDFEDEQLAKEIAASKADFEQIRTEYMQASAEAKAKLKSKLEEAKANLERSEARVKARLDALEKEAKAKTAALEKQIAVAKAEAREKIRQRIAAIKAEYEARSAKLKQALALMREALAA